MHKSKVLIDGYILYTNALCNTEMFSATHQRRPVNAKLLTEMWSCWHTDAICQSARNVILRSIQKDKLIFTRGGRRVRISRSLQIVIDNSWERFISNAVDSAFVSGCVVYYFAKHPTQKFVPMCAAEGTYNLFVTTTDCSTKLEAEPIDPESTQELFVWDGFGWNFNRHGQPGSPCASILPIINTIRSYVDTGAVPFCFVHDGFSNWTRIESGRACVKSHDCYRTKTEAKFCFAWNGGVLHVRGV